MKKQILSQLLLTSAVGALLVGCSTDEQDEIQIQDQESADVEEELDSSTTEEDTAAISIVIDGETMEELSREVTVTEESTLFDVMENNYDIEDSDGFISSIEGYEQDAGAQRYWLYYINGEMPTVGAKEYVLQDEDHIEWKLEDSE